MTAAAIAVIVGLIAPLAEADTTEQDLAKYKKLRQRLITEFTSVGPAQGQSQPCPERNDTAKSMKWGDSTIALGFYIGVLATEHYMLSNPAIFPGADNGDTTQLAKTLDELYYALRAMERLDNDADAAFPPPCTTTPALNGFFIRDDVPANFNTKFPGIDTIMSDYIDPVLTNKEESQDQVYHVQHGLALVIKLVPASVMVKGKALRAWAMEQAKRIAQHFAKGDWKIRNPACSDRIVNRGGDASGYSYGETLAVTYLTAGTFTPTTSATYKLAWDTLQYPFNPVYVKADNLHMALAIMAVGNGYGANTAQVMATLADLQDWPLYPLLHRALHGSGATGFCSTAAAVNARARLMLDELPLASEPACPAPGGPAPHGFTTHNRFIRSKDQAYVGSPGCAGLRYHGLDYMLLHNLYAIATPGTWKGSPNANPCAVVDSGAKPTLDRSSDRPTDAATSVPDGAALDVHSSDGATTTTSDVGGAGKSGCSCELGGTADPSLNLLPLCLGLVALLGVRGLHLAWFRRRAIHQDHRLLVITKTPGGRSVARTPVRACPCAVMATVLVFLSSCPTRPSLSIADKAAHSGTKRESSPATELFALRVRDVADTWRYYAFAARRKNEVVLRHGSVVSVADKVDAAEFGRARCAKLTRDLALGEGDVVTQVAAFTELSFRRPNYFHAIGAVGVGDSTSRIFETTTPEVALGDVAEPGKLHIYAFLETSKGTKHLFDVTVAMDTGRVLAIARDDKTSFKRISAAQCARTKGCERAKNLFLEKVVTP